MKAFTLIEVIVTLLLSSIIIGIAISGYTITNQQFKLFDTSTEQSLDILRLNNLIKSDIDKSDVIFYENNQLVCKNEQIETTYNFNSEAIIRNLNTEIPRKDSICLKFEKLEVFFNDEIKDFGIIDNIMLTITSFEIKQQLHYTKRYSALELMHYVKK